MDDWDTIDMPKFKEVAIMDEKTVNEKHGIVELTILADNGKHYKYLAFAKDTDYIPITTYFEVQGDE